MLRPRFDRQNVSQLAISMSAIVLLLPLSGCNDMTDVRAADANTLLKQELPSESQEIAIDSPVTETSESTSQQAEEKAEEKTDGVNSEPTGSGSSKRADLNKADDAQLSESERRLRSLAKSYKKEDRPEKPNFDGRAVKNGAITFDDLKFEMKKSERFKRTMLTDSVNQMVGERLQIKGFMHPNSRKREIKKFIFVRDDKECCFGPTAALYDCVLVSLAKGEKGKYSLRPVTVEGDFYLDEFDGPDGRVWAVYRLKNGVIKE